MAEQAIKKRYKRSRWTRDDTELTLLAFPTIVWYFLFCFLPMFGIIIAFKDVKLNGSGGFLSSLLSSKWVGFKNFEFLFKSSDLWPIIRNTLGYNILFLVINIVLPVILAILINQLYSKRATKVYQTAMFLPYFMSWLVVSYFVTAFLDNDKGLVNHMMMNMGMEPVQWYMKSEIWPYLLIFLNTWKNMGYSMVVYLATITGIDSTFYEAAIIDGATKWQQTKYITLPIMKTIIIIMFIMNVGRIFYSDFGLFYQVPKDSNSLFDVTIVIDVYLYRALSTTTVGMASAIAFLQSVLGCVTILIANGIVRKIDPESAMI
ncbi:MAG: sugar ABC transporter permease [Clostridiales bacterium]|nr:sugar ABC transporter permease [Clostridiales bacterium]